MTSIHAHGDNLIVHDPCLAGGLPLIILNGVPRRVAWKSPKAKDQVWSWLGYACACRTIHILKILPDCSGYDQVLSGFVSA